MYIYIALCHYKLCTVLICAHCTWICRLVFPFFLPLCTVSFSFSRDFLCLGVFVYLLKSIYSFFFFLSFHFNPISFDCFFFFLCFFFGGTVVANYSNSFLSFWYLECVHIVRKRFADGLVRKGPTHYSIFSIQQMVTKSHFVCSFGNSCVFLFPPSKSFSFQYLTLGANERHIFLNEKHNDMEELNAAKKHIYTKSMHGKAWYGINHGYYTPFIYTHAQIYMILQRIQTKVIVYFMFWVADVCATSSWMKTNAIILQRWITIPKVMLLPPICTLLRFVIFFSFFFLKHQVPFNLVDREGNT